MMYEQLERLKDREKEIKKKKKRNGKNKMK